MASNSVATGSLNLTTNATAMTAGMQQAGQDIKNWANKTNSTLAKSGKDSGSSFANSLQIPIAGALAGFGLAAFENTVDKIGELASKIKIAQLINEDVTAFTALGAKAAAYGITLEGLAGTLEKQSKVIYAVINGNKELGKTFDRIGLKAEELVNMSKIDQFRSIAEAIHNIKNESEQAAAGFELYGKKWVQVHGLMKDGSKGIDDIIAQMTKMGVAIKGSDVDKILQAASATKAFQKQWDAFKQSLTIAAAPAVAAVFGTMKEALDTVAPLLERYVRAVSFWWNLLAKGFTEAKNAVVEFGEMLTRNLGLGNLLKDVDSLENTLIRIAKVIAIPLAYAWDVARKAFGEFLDGARKGLGIIVGLTYEIVESLAKSGAIEREGAERIKSTLAQFGRLLNFPNKTPELTKFIKDLKETKIGSTVEQVSKWLDGLNKKPEVPKPNKKEAEPNINNPGEKEKKQPKEISVSAMLKGSAELATLESRLQNFAMTGVNGDIQEQQLDRLDKILEEQKKGNDLRKDGNDKLQDLADD